MWIAKIKMIIDAIAEFVELFRNSKSLKLNLSFNNYHYDVDDDFICKLANLEKRKMIRFNLIL